MSAPQRVQRRRVTGWRLPVGAKIVDRSSRWGNPFAVRRVSRVGNVWEVYLVRDMDGWGKRGTVVSSNVPDRATAHLYAVRWYRRWFPSSGLDASLLAGHDLACPCDPEYPCHVDVLLELANAEVDR